MRELRLPEHWYADALWSGEYAALKPHDVLIDPLGNVTVRKPGWMSTHLGPLALPTADEPLYHRISNVGGVFKIAGQAHYSLRTHLWLQGIGWEVLSHSCGVSPVIFDKAGQIHLSDCSIGSQGWRYVAPNGTLVTGDATYPPVHGLNEWTDLSDAQDRSFVVGQANDKALRFDCPPDSCLLWDGKVHRLIEAGTSRFIRGDRDPSGTFFSFAIWKPGEGVVIKWFTLSELMALPTIAILPEPKPEPPFEPKPILPARPADNTVYDLMDYLIGDPGLWPRTGTHPMHQHLGPGLLFHFVKFDNPEAYETWAFDDNWVYHLEDASGHHSGPYSFLDPRWFPRRMKIGQSRGFDSGEHETVFRERSNCQPIRTEPFRRKMWLHAVYPAFDWGKDLGIRETIVVAYDPTGGFHEGRGVELGYYAKGAGSVRWEYYHATAVYRHGRTADFNLAPAARSDFYYFGGKTLAPKRTGCVGNTIPSLPPLDAPEPPPIPIPKPEPKETLMLYVELEPNDALKAEVCERIDNGNGTVSLKSVNRTEEPIVCLTPDGNLEWRPIDHAGSPWESFFLAGSNTLVAERELDGKRVAYLRLCAEVK
jgi:hypothetical protein